MFSRVLSGGIIGVDSYKLEVEVDCCGGIGQIQVVGLPDAAVKESQERVRSAIKACGYLLPAAKKWVINLAPADTRKEGPAYDLPMAIGILTSSKLLPDYNLSKLWIIGELGLDGGVRPVVGVLPLAISCKQSGAEGIIVPEANAEEAALVDGLKVYPVSHLKQAALIVQSMQNGAVFDGSFKSLFEREAPNTVPTLDFSDVKGQIAAKEALAVAAAGRHNVLLVGPPGAGKSMLAERIPGIMPPLEYDEAIELTKLYSVAGLLSSSTGLIKERPFRAPHHSASVAGLVGGGRNPKPGEISLSHHGILFLDELTEFSRSHLENLRQPLENQKVTLSRAMQSLTYPASFLFVGACNPCPCGFRGDLSKYCVCTVHQADRYWSRLSGPILDRIDIQIRVSRLEEKELSEDTNRCAESSQSIRMRVQKAVYKQMERNVTGKGENGNGRRFYYNGQLPSKLLARVCNVSELDRHFLARKVTELGLSARAYDRVLRMAMTIADIEDSERVQRQHLMRAIHFRGFVHSSAI